LFAREFAAHAPRTHVRFTVSRATALAGVGETARASALTAGILDAAARIDSATVRVDLRRLAAVLGRRRRDPDAAAVLPDLRRLVRGASRLVDQEGNP
jgi:hypothetical protein